MTPQEILAIRRQSADLETTAAQLNTEGQHQAADSIRRSGAALLNAVEPYCWSCGARLQAWDMGDHLCQSCIGGLPLDYPN